MIHHHLADEFVKLELNFFVIGEKVRMNMESVLKHLQNHSTVYVDRLKVWVAIQSISSEPEKRREVVKMVEHVRGELERLGAKTELKDIGTQKVTIEGEAKEIDLPPVLLAQLGNDPNKNTLCIYGHLDVQPAKLADGWSSEPFELTIDNQGRMFGRGSSDDKGPVLGWINVVEAFNECKVDIPINLKFVFEGMEESGSVGLEKLVEDEKDKFLKDVDFVCISDNSWLGNNKPCICYGLRGLAYFEVSVVCACKDLHSGVYGGAVHEGMTDLMDVMSALIDPACRILIPGLNEMVAPLTEEEGQLYSKLDFSPNYFKNEIGAAELMNQSKEDLLMSLWRFPYLSIHGIESAFYGPRVKTVIPRKVIGKFSIRLVPNMKLEEVEKCVVTHFNSEFEKLGSPNKFEASLLHSVEAWVTDVNNPQYVAGREACKKVFGTEPDLIRDGGSVPTALYFQHAMNRNVMLLPMGACDDSTHSQNEKLDQRNFFKGMELFAHYFVEMGKIIKY